MTTEDSRPATMSGLGDLEEAWDELHASPAAGMGRRTAVWYHDEAHVWEQYAYRPSELAKASKRHYEWTATAPTESECVRERARCLREIRAGRWPV